MDSSSVLSDESMLTQWSVSTQRSMLSVGDFPPVRDASSPNRCGFTPSSSSSLANAHQKFRGSSSSLVMIPARGLDQEGFEISRVELGRVRIFSSSHGPGPVTVLPDLTRPDPT